ncbi:MAG: right-handed parallel beta-helix repeat-containing protein [Anaerolineae bacterium]|nr:right-handed parallel beta-helix repeat-containing protein [Anaerolineae bacterium]
MRSVGLFLTVFVLALVFPLSTQAARPLPVWSPHMQAAPACTRYVAADGSDTNPGTQDRPWTTLQMASDSARPSDVICIGAGTYIPEGGDWIITRPGSADQPVTYTTYNGPVTIRGTVLIEPGASHVRLAGFTITGFRVWGMSVAGVEDVVLSGLDISGGEAGIRFTVSLEGDEAPVSRVTIEDSLIHDALYTGVDCTPGPCNDMIFRRLEISGGGQGNADFGADGLGLERGQNILVEDCYIHDNSGDGIDLNSRDMMRGDLSGTVIVRRNRVENNLRNGIKVWRGGEVANNVVWNSGDTLLVVEQDSEYTITHNTFVSLNGYNYLAVIGYDEVAGSTTRVTLYNNVFANHDPAMGGTMLYVSPNVTLDAGNNLFYNPYREDDVICIGDACFSAEQINDGTYATQMGHGPSLYGDPLFLDVVTGDFRLSAGSPAIDAASADYAVDDDLAGEMRPQGRAADLGAYEVRPGR